MPGVLRSSKAAEFITKNLDAPTVVMHILGHPSSSLDVVNPKYFADHEIGQKQGWFQGQLLCSRQVLKSACVF